MLCNNVSYLQGSGIGLMGYIYSGSPSFVKLFNYFLLDPKFNEEILIRS